MPKLEAKVCIICSFKFLTAHDVVVCSETCHKVAKIHGKVDSYGRLVKPPCPHSRLYWLFASGFVFWCCEKCNRLRSITFKDGMSNAVQVDHSVRKDK